MPIPSRSSTPLSKQTKETLWRKRFAEFQRSKLSVAQFCQSVGCSVPSFYHWKRKLEKPAKTSAFIQLVTADPPPLSLEIKLPNGLSILLPIDAIEALPRILEQVA